MGMKVWAALGMNRSLAEVPNAARRAEAMGFDGIMGIDSITDGFLVCQAAIGATEKITVATGALVAFPRSPLITAVAAPKLTSMRVFSSIGHPSLSGDLSVRRRIR